MKSSSWRIRWQVLWSALKEAWPAWLLVVEFGFSWFPVAYFLTFLTTSDLTTQVRYEGVLLEVFGFVLVAFGIRQTRRLFDRPSLIAKIVGWFRQLASAFGGPKTHTVSLSGVGAVATTVCCH